MTEGLAVGQTIQSPTGMTFGATDWDGHPAQAACVDVDAPRLLAEFRALFVRS